MAVFADLLPSEGCVSLGAPWLNKVRFKYRAIGGVKYFPIAVDILTGFAIPLILVADFGELVFGDNVFDFLQGWVVLVVDESFAKYGVECALDKDWALFRKRIANKQSCVRDSHVEIV